MIRLTRKYDFSATHRLYNPDFTDEQNCEVFRECNNINGHGHNYELEVTVRGVPDDQTGMIVDIDELDQIVMAKVVTLVDHKNLNLDVDFMTDLIPTAENIVWAFWQQLAEPVNTITTLDRLRLIETKNNFAEYHGEKGEKN